MTAQLTGKIALVTGGGTNIGRTTTLTLAREGATVVVAGRSAQSLAETVEAIEAEGGKGDSIVVDVTQQDEVERMVVTTVKRHGGLHIAFNNAGTIGKLGPLAELTKEDWSQVFDVNTTGLWLSMKYEIEHMRHNGGGVIINSASNIGSHARRPGMAAYAASKAAVSVLSRTAAREYIADGIRINTISAGGTDTPMSYRTGENTADRDARVRSAVPLGRVATTQEIANAVLWLTSDQSSFVVGHDLVIDGGATA
ncbi:glucose 1-dehydrogenase [Streptomyces sioyaensis]|uniref:SDR family NAD(P)-dependent oxidoreductase n=1 Tax=Streptomyces sioyaensis TaxID=67364 RepID=UPI0036E6116C